MKPAPRRYAAPTAAVVLMAGAWQLARPPATSAADAARAAAGLAFVKQPLTGPATSRTLRPVAPGYERIRSWISSVGAAVALADIDGNGRPDDACVVDPRDDSVRLLPAPGTGRRYAALKLDPAPLPYDATMAPMGCVPGDYNEDGVTDVLVYYWGRSPVMFLQHGGRFRAQELVSPYQVWNTNAVSLADFDGDGRTDIVVGNYFPDGARVLDPSAHQPQLRMQRSMSAARNGGRDRVLLSRSGRRGWADFVEAPGAFRGVPTRGWTLAIGAQDLDGDGRPELYFADDFGPDRLLRNMSGRGRVRFQAMRGVRHPTTPKSKVLGRDSFKGMGVAFTDLNDDAVPDMVVSNITERYALQESNFAWLSTQRSGVLGTDGTAHYDDHSEGLGLSRSGWGWDVKAGDFAGVGSPAILQATGFVKGEVNRWPELQELAMTNDDLLDKPGAWPRFRPGDDLSGHDPDRFFARGADGRFVDVAARIGVADRGVSRGIALADLEHDGRLDYAVAGQWRPSYLFRNVRRSVHPYLGLRLLRPTGCGGVISTPPTPAIGTAVTVESGAVGLRTGQLYPANGHAGVSASELLFALRARSAGVVLSWRDGCGTRHTARTELAAGWNVVLLRPDGTIRQQSEWTGVSR